MSKVIPMATTGPVWHRPMGRSKFGSIVSGCCRKQSHDMPWGSRNTRGDTGFVGVARA